MTTTGILIIAACAALVSAASPVSATTYHISPDGSGDFPTIQAAIDAAVSGDEIVLSDGTFAGIGNWNLDFGTKELVLRSQNGYEATTLDGGFVCIEYTPLRRAAILEGGQTSATQIVGLTMQHFLAERGVIRCVGTAPVIRACRFRLNLGWEDPHGRDFVAEAAAPIIQDCFFEGGVCSPRWRDGVGVYGRGSWTTIERCSFSHVDGTSAVDLDGGTLTDCLFFRIRGAEDGQGICVRVRAGQVSLQGCRFEHNFGEGVVVHSTAQVVIGGCVFDHNVADSGCGVLSGGASTTIQNTTFRNNYSGFGGGIVYFYGGSNAAALDHCVFLNNTNSYPGGASAVFASGTDLQVTHCTFVGNRSVQAGYQGSAFTLWNRAHLSMDHTIIASGGQAGLPDGAIHCGSAPGSLFVTCSDFYGNEGGDWTGCVAGMDGVNKNFSADPLFCDVAGEDLASPWRLALRPREQRRMRPDRCAWSVVRPAGSRAAQLGFDQGAVPMKENAMRMSVIAACVSLLAAAPLSATTYHVSLDGSGDFPTIGAALAAAAFGDSLVLTPGVFHEHNLALKSGIVIRGDGIPESVVIDGDGARVLVGDGVSGTRVERLTIEDGVGTNIPPGWGGGVLLHQSSAVIDSVRFRACAAIGGGGIFLWECSGVTISHCVFYECVGEDLGGGMESYISNSVVIDHNTVVLNTGGRNAGVTLNGGSVFFTHNLLFDNYNGDRPPTLAQLWCLAGTHVIDCNLFWNTTSPGAGVACDVAGTNIFAPPEFCDLEAHDFRLVSGSPGTPAYSGGCGLIGALPLCPGFAEVSFAAQVGRSTGVGWLDLDGDGDVDSHVLRTLSEADVGYENLGDGSFSPFALPSPLNDPGDGQGMDWGDYDNDGDLDLYLINATSANKLLRNDGGGSFADATTPPIDQGCCDEGATWIDYDRDGRLDLYVTTGSAQSNRLYRNVGGAFVDTTPAALAIMSRCASSAWGDYDGDGDSDVYVSVVDGPNRLVRNDSDGSFTDVTAPPVDDSGTAQGAAWGDYDNDGDIDLYVCNFGQANRLFRNDGANFVDVATGPLADANQSQSGTWADFDNDRDLDLALTNFGQPSYVLQNDGGNSFVRVATIGDSAQSLGAAWGDYDEDGDEDLFVANFESADKLFQNIGGGNKWLEVTLQGTASNRSAMGARIIAVDFGTAVTQMREHGSNHGFWSCNAPAEHFGLGSSTQVDLLIVHWPSGSLQSFQNVLANQRITIVEGGGIVGVPELLAQPLRVEASPNPFREGVQISWSSPRRQATELEIFNVMGRLVRSFPGQAGDRTVIVWDGRDGGGQPLGSGVYFYRLKSGSEHLTGKLLRLR